MDEKKGKTGKDWENVVQHSEIAELSEACCEKIRDCEREINKGGYWNIALVAYQLKD